MTLYLHLRWTQPRMQRMGIGTAMAYHSLEPASLEPRGRLLAVVVRDFNLQNMPVGPDPFHLVTPAP